MSRPTEMAMADHDPTSTDRPWNGRLTGTVLHADGSQEPFDHRLHLNGEVPTLRAVFGRAVRIETGSTSVWIVAADPAGTPSLPYLFGLRPTGRGPRLVWYPLGFTTSGSDALFQPTLWSISYRVLDGTLATPPTMLPAELEGELDGLTAVP